MRNETTKPQEKALAFLNSAKDKITLKVQYEDYTSAQIYGYNGVLTPSIDISSEETTIYIIKISSDEDVVIQKLAKE